MLTCRGWCRSEGSRDLLSQYGRTPVASVVTICVRDPATGNFNQRPTHGERLRGHAAPTLRDTRACARPSLTQERYVQFLDYSGRVL